MYVPCANSEITRNDRTGQYLWQFTPCTLAIVAGPFISAVYRLTKDADAELGSFSLAQALRGMLCLMMFLSLYLSRRLRLLEHALIRPMMFLAIYALLTAFISPYPYENIVFAIKTAFIVLVFVCAFHLAQSDLCSENWLWGSAWAVLLLMAISQAIGLLTGRTIAVYRSDYATAGVIGATSVAAALIVSALPVFLRFFPNLRLSLGGILVSFVSLFFTMRRTELIAGACAIFLVMVYNVRPRERSTVWAKTLLTVLFLSLLVLIGMQTQAGADLLSRISEMNPTTGSGSGRYVFWPVSLKHILDRGVDFQIFGEGMGSIKDLLESHIGLAIGSHTDWLDLTHAFGVFGLIALILWFIELIRFAINQSRLKDSTVQGVFSAIVILFLISIGQGGLFDPAFAMIYAALGFWAGRVSYRNTLWQTYF